MSSPSFPSWFSWAAFRHVLLPAWVKLAIDNLQPIQSHVGVDLAGGNVGVSKDGLHGAQVGAVFYQVRGAAVAEHVWAGMTRGSRSRAHHLPDPLSGKAASAATDKQDRRNSAVQQPPAALFEIMTQRILRGSPQRHQAFLVALSADQHMPQFQLQIF